MNLSLVLHSIGPKSSDFVIYLTNKDEYYTWYKVGLIQSFTLEVDVNNPFPKYSFNSVLGFNVVPCEEPSFYDGLAVICDDFIKDDTIRVTIGNILVVNCNVDKSTLAPDSAWVKFGLPIGGVQKLYLNADVEYKKSTVKLTGFKSTFEIINNFEKLPEWVDVSYIDYDCLKEAGIDGADSVE